MFEKPPKWREMLTPELFANIMQSPDVATIIRKAQKNYLYWDKFKFYPFPDTIEPHEAWAYLKVVRNGSSDVTPIISIDDEVFNYNATNTLQKKLSYIDTYCAGTLQGITYGKPTEAQKNHLIISGLSEEAIASSQLEGASTSRKVAKEMILSQRKPTTRDEQMIINNYRVMQRVQDLKDFDLSEDILLEIQKNITEQTLDDENDSGRFRNDHDSIVVSDRLTGEVVFVPPKEEQMKRELVRLIEYVNSEKDEEDFIHPLVEASMVHFWLAYLHPFPDGNGRTARALFYWYLLKKGYWLVQYLSISKVIKQSRKKYDNAFLYTEHDDNDLTYFLLYIAEVTEKAIDDFHTYYKEEIKKSEQLRSVADQLKKFNSRQVALMYYLEKKPDTVIDVVTHQNKHGISLNTARADLLKLVKNGYLIHMKDGRKSIFTARKEAIQKFIKKV